MLSSARRNISYPNPDHSDRPDVPAHMLNLVNALEVDMIYTQGSSSARASAAHLAGVFWYETDTQNSYYDDGSNWHYVGTPALSGVLGSRPAPNTVPVGAIYRATDNGIIYRSDGTNWTLWAVSTGAVLDEALVASNSGSIAVTTEATAVTAILGNSVTYDGTRVKVEAFFPGTVPSVALTCTYVLFRDTTPIGQVAVYMATASVKFANKIEVFDTPAAGAHVYKVSVFVNTGNVVINAGAGGTGQLANAWMRVVKA